MVHLAWKHHQQSRGRKKPLYGVEKGRRRQGPVAKIEVGNLHTGFRSPLSPVADLVAQQFIGTMGGSKSGTSIVQVCVPEFKAVYFRVVKKGRCVVGIVGGDDKQNELCEVLEKT